MCVGGKGEGGLSGVECAMYIGELLIESIHTLLI